MPIYLVARKIEQLQVYARSIPKYRHSFCISKIHANNSLRKIPTKNSYESYLSSPTQIPYEKPLSSTKDLVEFSQGSKFIFTSRIFSLILTYLETLDSEQIKHIHYYQAVLILFLIHPLEY